MALDQNRIVFLRGVLAAFASNWQVVHYNEIRRLCRFSQEQLGEYLDAARQPLVQAGLPDFNVIVVNDQGWPGDGWTSPGPTDPKVWAQNLRATHIYWRDRKQMDNTEFEQEHGMVPPVPGLPNE
jgi:hypothetical protein